MAAAAPSYIDADVRLICDHVLARSLQLFSFCCLAQTARMQAAIQNRNNKDQENVVQMEALKATVREQAVTMREQVEANRLLQLQCDNQVRKCRSREITNAVVSSSAHSFLYRPAFRHLCAHSETLKMKSFQRCDIATSVSVCYC